MNVLENLPELQAVVYVSASSVPMTQERLEGLLIEAREFNRANGITGVLLCADNQFMQYFEGPGPAVHATYERIRASRSHSRIIEMMNEPIRSREFPDWEMALAQPTPSELVALSTAAWVTQKTRSLALDRTSIGLALLRDFWRRQRRWR